MAQFIPVEKDKYSIVGILTDEDINTINSFKNRTTLILENTVGLSSELVSKITSDRIVFSIKGGLDYDKKEKYKESKYVERTFVSPIGLTQIIKYFEYNEKLIDPNWNEFEKSMFLYNALVVDIDYSENYENILTKGTVERSLNGLLYGKLVCAGFAQAYKEMLDRVGIKNHYQNQKDTHAFNIIEIDGKKYGVDVTWDNDERAKNDGVCGFRKFATDEEFYSRHGHQLYKEVNVAENFEETIIERVYDPSEEVFDLSVLDIDQIKGFYTNIASKVQTRKPVKCNLQDQPLKTRSQYLPVDMVDFKLKEEATQEFPITIILDFLKNRNVSQVDPQLVNAFSSRKGYLSDIGSTTTEYRYGEFDLSSIGLNNFRINRDGSLEFNDGTNRRRDITTGVNAGNFGIFPEELNSVYSFLNQYSNNYLNEYIFNILNGIDTLLENYEYKPDEFDENRFIENSNTYSKLAIIENARDYIVKLGVDEEKLDSIIKRIRSKYDEIHKPYEKEVNQKENDLDFLSAIFEDIDLIWKTMEYDLQKQITEEEFISLFSNVDYVIKVFEQYIIIRQEEKFSMSDYSISKEDLQELLNKIIQDYQKSKLEKANAELNEVSNPENTEKQR